jgi:hypothetical protein
VILGLTVVISFAIQWYALRYLPFVDCLPFKKGANILEKMKPPPGAIPDSTVIQFVYKKNDKVLEFSADNLPADLDSTYQFVKRYDKIVRKGNAEAEIKDFSLISESGTDSTVQILDKPGYLLMLISKNFPNPNPNWNKQFILLYTLARSKNIPMIVVSSNKPEAAAWMSANNLIFPLLGCDATAVKTAARVDPTLYLLKKGTILDKWSYVNLNMAMPEVAELSLQRQ